MEAESGRVLAAQNADARLPMASTTKVVSAIVVIENCDINKKIKVPAAAVGIEGSSIYLQKDEEITIEALLYGLMLQSGNDCAVALALHAGGTVENFSLMMNALAKKAGAENSNFKNPHGLHHKEHYTTAADLCRISCYAMKNPTFKKIVSTKQYKTEWAGRDYPRVINSKNKILFQYGGGNGVKTGFTKAAGRCLVSAAERGGMQLVCVVLNCGPMFQDCMHLMSYGFDNYKMTEILPPQKHVGAVGVANGRQTYVRAYTYKPLSYPLKDGEAAQIRYVSDVPEKVDAPIKKDQKLGEIKIYLLNRLLFTESVCAMDEVKSTTLSERIGEIIDEIF
jgi:D-alanyl-D-alanine carboxypeptidase (penicillin-binding protein 5/6)